MQNCLQKAKRKPRAKKAVVIILAFAAATLAAAVFVGGKSTSIEPGGQSVTGCTVFAGNGDTMYKTQDKESINQSSEMNNLMQDNAKTHIFDKKTAKKASDCIAVRVLLADDSIVEMPVEEYVKGCVYGEMPLSFEPQALMAQSVAARTFAVHMMDGASKHKNADVCTSPACCQHYVVPDEEIIGSENFKKLCDCTLATKGVVLTYEGKPIEAVYHASSGSGTLNSEDVWGGRLDYLRAVKSPDGETAISAFGMGHRVGMSQHGANLLAKEGMGYMEILKYYYSGISFDFL